jgi:hypothetical protein
VGDRVHQSQKTALPIFYTSLKLFLVHKTGPSFPQPNNIAQIIEIFSIPFQNLKEGCRQSGLLIRRMILEVGCNHGEKTVWANAAVKVRIKVTNSKYVLEEDDDSLDLWHFGNPILHEKSRLISHTRNSTQIYRYIHFNRPACWAFACI